MENETQEVQPQEVAIEDSETESVPEVKPEPKPKVNAKPKPQDNGLGLSDTLGEAELFGKGSGLL